MRNEQRDELICRLRAVHTVLTEGSDTLLWCKQYELYNALDELREHGKNSKSIRLVAARLSLIFRYRGTRVFVSRLGSIIHELEGLRVLR